MIGGKSAGRRVLLYLLAQLRKIGKRQSKHTKYLGQDMWPPVRMSDGTIRKGPSGRVIGRWRA